MNERRIDDNSNERMADRPKRDEARVDDTPLPLTDTAPETGEAAPVDDV